MGNIKYFLITNLLSFASLFSYGFDINEATIIFKAFELKYETIFYVHGKPADRGLIKLDSVGGGIIRLPIKSPSFIDIYISGQIPNTIYLEPGSIVNVNIEKEVLSFSGDHSAINSFLDESKKYYTEFQDSINAYDDANLKLEQFKGLCDKYESRLYTLYQKWCYLNLPEKELDYLLKTNLQVFLHIKKEDFISNSLATPENDYTKLEYDLGLKINSLLDDSIYIKAPSSQFLWYLTKYYRRLQNNSLTSLDSSKLRIGNSEMYMINILHCKNELSEEVKKYLFCYYLLMEIGINSPLPIYDTLIAWIKNNNYEFSEYELYLENVKKTFAHLKPGKPAPALTGISPVGRVYSINDFKGKIIIIDIWATWCSPCIAQLPHTLQLQETYRNNSDLIFIFLSHDNDEAWKKYLKGHPEFKGFHLRRREIEDRPLGVAWKISGIPRYIIIDKKGNIIDAFANNAGENIKSLIDSALMK